MATANIASEHLQVFLCYSKEDQIIALALMKQIRQHPDIHCFGLDRTPGKSTAQCMEQAINKADYFLLFLSPHLLRRRIWIRAIVYKVKEEINNKLTIVLYGMSDDEFTNGVKQQFDLTINQQNVIYDPWAKWDTVAQQIFRNCNLQDSTSLSKPVSSGKQKICRQDSSYISLNRYLHYIRCSKNERT